MMQPFLTFYTPTFRRPAALSRCLQSVSQQTALSDIEHLVIPDYIGLGIGGMYQRVKDYASAVHGQYVHLLADDDELASPTVVESVMKMAMLADFPPVILVRANKGGSVWPQGVPWPPVCGAIDLGCIITRADVWKAHVTDYGNCYEGDFFFMQAVAKAGHPAMFCDVLFLNGDVSRGEPETVEIGPNKWVRPQVQNK